MLEAADCNLGLCEFLQRAVEAVSTRCHCPLGVIETFILQDKKMFTLKVTGLLPMDAVRESYKYW